MTRTDSELAICAAQDILSRSRIWIKPDTAAGEPMMIKNIAVDISAVEDALVGLVASCCGAMWRPGTSGMDISWGLSQQAALLHCELADLLKALDPERGELYLAGWRKRLLEGIEELRRETHR